jgi:cell division protein FtsI/penicillin-binding protein 2
MPPYSSGQLAKPIQAVLRARLWYVLIMVVFGVFVVRLFYLQIIRHDYYNHVAAVGHLKEYEINAKRGVIEAHDGNSVVPIVLDQTLYTVYADPTLVKDPAKVAQTLSDILKGNESDYETLLRTKDTRYVVLAHKATQDQQKALLAKQYPGVGAQEQSYRTYPDGSLASQLLGIVKDDGVGTYGIEQALNKQLSGTNGELKAVTDVHGVPLAANTSNVLKQPVSGDNVVLTIDVAMQKQLEDILKTDLQKAKSDNGTAVIMDVHTGAIKAMANYPTYDPNHYDQVEDSSLFMNAAVSSPIEVGSSMKSLTAAAALNQGVIQPNTTYNDPAHFVVDDFNITNIEEDGGAGVKSISDILNLSLNTGATWMLMQMSSPGGTQITKKGRDTWYDYMVNRYGFGSATGIEQGYEATGTVPDPDNGYARDLTYANTAFGQAMTATPVQMAAAYSAVLNGGTYYRPRLVDQYVSADGKVTTVQPDVVHKNVVSPKVSQEMQPLLEYVVEHHYFPRPFDENTYSVGGKTGTAQIANPNGGYYDNQFNGTYLGFVGGDQPQYVIAVFALKPQAPGYAGTAAAQPIFGDLAHMLIDKFNVTPKTK